MLSLRFLVPLAALLSTTLAAPQAAATTCTKYFTTFTAKFEHVATGTAVPYDFASVTWTNFEVVAGADTGVPPASGSRVAVAPPYGAALTQNDGEMYTPTEAFGLQGFAFGCYAIEGGRPVQQECSLLVVGQTHDRDIAFQSEGPFSYGGGAMTNATLSNPYAANFYFILVGGQGNSLIVVDNMVISNFNRNCPPPY